MAGAVRIGRLGDAVILYDDTLAGHPRAEWFEPGLWPALDAAAGGARGRGPVRLVSAGGSAWVLRPYLRGGLVGRVVRDRYLWLGAERTRGFREWRLLRELRRRGLAVPAPVAASYTRAGATYRAQLLTVWIPGLQSLAHRVRHAMPDAAAWRSVGAAIAALHAEHVCHADLNAHNVHFDAGCRVHVLDLDRGRFMEARGAWCGRNLARLRRSLEGLWPPADAPPLAEAWREVTAAYREACASPARGGSVAA